MAKLVFGLQQSLDGYVDHLEMGPPDPALSRHFVEHVRDLAGCVYGRRTYEIMRYWDEDQPDWDAEDVDFAAAWRSLPKWVVSRSLNHRLAPVIGGMRYEEKRKPRGNKPSDSENPGSTRLGN